MDFGCQQENSSEPRTLLGSIGFSYVSNGNLLFMLGDYADCSLLRRLIIPLLGIMITTELEGVEHGICTVVTNNSVFVYNTLTIRNILHEVTLPILLDFDGNRA
jgi:hypothetical protein